MESHCQGSFHHAHGSGVGKHTQDREQVSHCHMPSMVKEAEGWLSNKGRPEPQARAPASVLKDFCSLTVSTGKEIVGTWKDGQYVASQYTLFPSSTFNNKCNSGVRAEKPR